MLYAMLPITFFRGNNRLAAIRAQNHLRYPLFARKNTRPLPSILRHRRAPVLLAGHRTSRPCYDNPLRIRRPSISVCFVLNLGTALSRGLPLHKFAPSALQNLVEMAIDVFRQRLWLMSLQDLPGAAPSQGDDPSIMVLPLARNQAGDPERPFV